MKVLNSKGNDSGRWQPPHWTVSPCCNLHSSNALCSGFRRLFCWSTSLTPPAISHCLGNSHPSPDTPTNTLVSQLCYLDNVILWFPVIYNWMLLPTGLRAPWRLGLFSSDSSLNRCTKLCPKAFSQFFSGLEKDVTMAPIHSKESEQLGALLKQPLRAAELRF